MIGAAVHDQEPHFATANYRIAKGLFALDIGPRTRRGSRLTRISPATTSVRVNLPSRKHIFWRI